MKNKKKSINVSDAEIINNETTTKPKISTVRAIKSDVLITIPISGAYYTRCYNIMTDLIDNEPSQEKFITSIVDWAENSGELTLNQAVVQTFMMLIKTIEEEATKNLELYTDLITIDENGKKIIIETDKK